ADLAVARPHAVLDVIGAAFGERAVEGAGVALAVFGFYPRAEQAALAEVGQVGIDRLVAKDARHLLRAEQAAVADIVPDPVADMRHAGAVAQQGVALDQHFLAPPALADVA